jgi:hypothetical protein
MDPVQKIWLYEQWLGDHRDDAELAKNHAYLLGSFSNPEAVSKMMNDNVHESSEEDFEESSRMVKEANLKLIEMEKSPRRRRRKAKLIQDKQG